MGQQGGTRCGERVEMRAIHVSISQGVPRLAGRHQKLGEFFLSLPQQLTLPTSAVWTAGFQNSEVLFVSCFFVLCCAHPRRQSSAGC